MHLAEAACGIAAPWLFIAAGLGLTAYVPELRRLPLLRRLAFAFLLGLAWVGVGCYIASYLFGVPIRLPLIWTLIALPLVSALALRPRGLLIARGPSKRPWHRPAWIAVVAFVSLVCLGVFADALAQPLRDFDGRMTWGHQARHVRAEGTVLPQVLRERQWFVTHPDYPLLMPIAQAVVLEAFGAADDAFFFRTLYATVLPALLLVLYEGARRRAGPRAALLSVLSLALLPFVAFGVEGGAAGGYSDVPVAAFYGAALVLLLRRESLESAAASGLLLAATVLCKMEGAILALGAVLACLTVTRQRRRAEGAHATMRFWSLAVAAGIALGAVGLYVFWEADVPSRGDEDYFGLLAHLPFTRLLADGAAALRNAAPAIATQMLAPKNWSILWWIAPIVLLTGARGLRTRRSLPLIFATAVPLLIAASAYLFQPEDPGFVRVTWNRFLLQACIPFFLLWAEAIRIALNGVTSFRPQLQSALKSAP